MASCWSWCSEVAANPTVAEVIANDTKKRDCQLVIFGACLQWRSEDSDNNARTAHCSIHVSLAGRHYKAVTIRPLRPTRHVDGDEADTACAALYVIRVINCTFPGVLTPGACDAAVESCPTVRCGTISLYFYSICQWMDSGISTVTLVPCLWMHPRASGMSSATSESGGSERIESIR
jgi:hypothetical protein